MKLKNNYEWRIYKDLDAGGHVLYKGTLPVLSRENYAH
jgi:hypothetical protein